jgi:hypothetical protein
MEEKSVLKKEYSHFWKSLESKGKLATVLGIIISFPVNVLAAILMYIDTTKLTENFVQTLIILNCIAIAWFILPSKFTMKGKNFELTVED